MNHYECKELKIKRKLEKIKKFVRKLKQKKPQKTERQPLGSSAFCREEC